MSSELLTELQRVVSGSGINLVGLAHAELFDLGQPRGRRARELLPRCETILVLGTGGRAFWSWLVAGQTDLPPRPRLLRETLRMRTAEIADEAAHWLQQRGVCARIVDPEACHTLNFVQLGEAAGLGTISPVTGFLLHPRFGPWVSMRAALLLPGFPFGCDFRGEVASSFQPCLTCQRPCVDACPIRVYDGDGGMELERCAAHLHRGGCATHCAVRRACPVGSEQRYGADEEAYRHALGIRLLRRCFGLGWWRLLPHRWRKN